MKKPKEYFFATLKTSKLLSDLDRSNLDCKFLENQRDSCATGSAGRAHYAAAWESEYAYYLALVEELQSRGVIL